MSTGAVHNFPARWISRLRLLLSGPEFWLFAIVGALAFVLRRSFQFPAGRELFPGPDAWEYAEVARRIAFGEGLGLDVSGVVFPSRYPVLFPLLLSPAARLLGGDAIRYPFLMAALGAVSVVLGGWLALRCTSSRAAGLLTALLLVFSCSHLLASHLVMSDLAFLVLFQGAALLCWRSMSHPPVRTEALFAGLLIGSLVAMRLPGFLVAGPLAFFYLIGIRHKASHIVLFIAGTSIPIGIELLHRLVVFGNPLVSAYAYYLPSHRPGSGFSPLAWEHFVGAETRIPNWLYYGRILAGIEPSVIAMAWAPIVLSIVGCVQLTRWGSPATEKGSRSLFLVLVLLGGPGLYLVLLSFYFWQESRLALVPGFVVLLLSSAGVSAIGRVGARLLHRPRRGWVLVVLLSVPLLYFQGRAARDCLRQPLPVDALGGELRDRLRGLTPPVLITDLGLLRVRSVLFPGPSDASPLLLSISDALEDDEHVYRNNRQPRWLGHPGIDAPALATWSDPRRFGSGEVHLVESTLDLIRRTAGESPSLLLLRQPTAKRSESTGKIMALLASRSDWRLEPGPQLLQFRTYWLSPAAGRSR